MKTALLEEKYNHYFLTNLGGFCMIFPLQVSTFSVEKVGEARISAAWNLIC